MEKRDSKNLGRYLFWGIIIVLVFLAYLILKPYLIALVSSFILSYLSLPLYKKLNKKISTSLSAIICILIIVLIIIIPLAFLTESLVSQARQTLSDPQIKSLFKYISTKDLIQSLGFNLESLREKIINFVIMLFTSIIQKIPSVLISLVITLWGMYFILIGWDSISNTLKQFLPYKDKNKIAKEISTITLTIVRGTIVIAFLDFIIASIGFYLIGIDSYFLLAAMIALLAFIPGVGPAAVWIPLLLFQLIQSNYFTAVGVLIIGLIMSIGIETLLLGKIIENKAKINPLISFIGILGGVPLFGIFGFVIGPLILILALKLIYLSIED